MKLGHCRGTFQQVFGLNLLISGILLGVWGPGESVLAERPTLTPNVPISEFQNHANIEPYDFDAPPKGIFQTIQFSEDYEVELGFHRGHEVVPINPNDRFHPDTRAVFIVFKLHQHYEEFQITGRCYPEKVDGLESTTLVAEDALRLALEDESGYLQFFAPPDGWKPGQYKVEVHIGWEVNEVSLMGTMRFSVVS